MSDKDNIIDFTKLKDKLSQEKESSKSEKIENKDGLISSLLEKIGFDFETGASSSDINEVLANIDMDALIENIQNGNITQQKIAEEVEILKNFEKKMSNIKKTYRAFTQWQSFYKPYDLSTLFPLNDIREIAKTMDIEYFSKESKNSIISKIIPVLPAYLERIFIKYDQNYMKFIGQAIQNDGVIVVDKMMIDSDETIIDFLQQKCILSRVNEMGKHIIVIPAEIKEALNKLDFIKIGKYNEINTFISKSAIAFANSYGVYPKALYIERIKEEIETKYSLIENAEEYISDLVTYYFNQKNSMKNLYHEIDIDENYVKHGLIHLTKHLFDIQNENIEKYKYLSKEEIYRRGELLHYEDSIHLKEVIDIISKKEKLDENEIINLKNIIYIFSFIEFEPNLVLQMIFSKYEIEDHNIYEILKQYYQNGEKWILKGHTPFEANNKKNVDMSNIIKLDFNNERE